MTRASEAEGRKNMKKILITGLNSFIGNSFEGWIKENYSKDYETDKISLRGKSADMVDFSAYDTVLYVTGIAHTDTNKNNKSDEALYYAVNTDLTYEMAKKAKADGVKQFIFLSSIIVYGNSAGIGEKKVITKNTAEAPEGFYGESKLRADKKLEALNCGSFKTAVVRPPMIYGKGSKGNYPRLAKIAGVIPFFPNIENERSMLYIDNLSEFLRLLADDGGGGYYFPQNREYVKTAELVAEIAKAKGKKIRLIKGFDFVIKLIGKRCGLVNKVFGNLVYDKAASSHFNNSYCIFDFEESIKRTEAKTH